MVTINAINGSDPLEVAIGGTGAATLTGVVTGNGTGAMTASTITQYGTVVAGASNAVSSVAPSATTGVPLVSQGASANPAYSTAVVAGGGTGLTSTTAYAVLCGGTTSTGALQSIAGVGTSGQVLTSNGAGALPTFQNATGTVTSGGSSTDNALARWNGTGGDTLQNSTVIVSDNGEMTNASQPAFMIGVNTTITNVTGDGTTYTVVYDTTLLDQTSDTASGIFTAPITGNYYLATRGSVQGGTAISVGNVKIVSTSITQQGNIDASALGGTTAQNTLSGIFPLTAADTVKIEIRTVDSGGKIDDIGGTNAGTWQNLFSGNLVC